MSARTPRSVTPAAFSSIKLLLGVGVAALVDQEAALPRPVQPVETGRRRREGGDAIRAIRVHVVPQQPPATIRVNEDSGVVAVVHRLPESVGSAPSAMSTPAPLFAAISFLCTIPAAPS